MNSSPTLWCGDALVVFDGPRRLAWRSISPAHWSPVALWPDANQAARVNEHLNSGGSVLIMVEGEQTSIPMYATEAARAPGALAAHTTIDGELAEIRISALDWLPDALRERGRRFLAETARFMEAEPDLLLPQLVVEQSGAEPCNLRFARLRTPRPYTDERLSSVLDHLFSSAVLADQVASAIPERPRFSPLESVS
jgi:hypothetical protein